MVPLPNFPESDFPCFSLPIESYILYFILFPVCCHETFPALRQLIDNNKALPAERSQNDRRIFSERHYSVVIVGVVKKIMKVSIINRIHGFSWLIKIRLGYFNHQRASYDEIKSTKKT